MTNLIQQAVNEAGLVPVSIECGVSFVAVHYWTKNGRLPRTELTGETQYASAIQRATGGQITAESLLAETRAAWLRRATA